MVVLEAVFSDPKTSEETKDKPIEEALSLH
jgi:hypothetical protein